MHCKVANAKPLGFPSTPVHTVESRTVMQKSNTSTTHRLLFQVTGKGSFPFPTYSH